jgi:threonyl-tRNA synthetase
MGQMKNVYKILVGKAEAKRQLGMLRRRGEDNIRMDLKEMVWEVMDWMDLT